MAPEPDILRHDAKRAWRAGPRKAFEQVTEQLGAEGHRLAGVAVASMVPSLTAVSRRGVPLLPGLLYGDREGRPTPGRGDDAVLRPGTMPDAEGFLRWAAAAAPDARGYWPCQAVATIRAVGAARHRQRGDRRRWARSTPTGAGTPSCSASIGVPESQMPMVVPMGQAAGDAARQRRRDHGRHHRRALRPDRRRCDRARATCW